MFGRCQEKRPQKPLHPLLVRTRPQFLEEAQGQNKFKVLESKVESRVCRLVD
jgi:hypothetical protein